MAEPTERDRARVREWWAAQSVVENPEFFHQDRDEAIVGACAQALADERARNARSLRLRAAQSPARAELENAAMLLEADLLADALEAE